MWHAPRFPGRILFSPGDHGPTGSRRSPHRRRSAVFRLERLEERTVLSPLIVTSGADSGPGSLRDIIASAPSGSVIEFAKSVHNITLTSGELQIGKSLDIEGPGANKLTISGNDASRVFDITNPDAEVTIAGLTITDGLANGSAPAPSSGGGILNSGTLKLDNDVLANNQAVGDPLVIVGGFQGEARGGAIRTFGTLNVTGCQFINNQALGASGSSGTAAAGSAVGGAIEISGGATGTVNISSTGFSGNVARGGNHCDSGTDSLAGLGNGGAIFNGSNLTVTDSTFRHNQAIGGNDNNGSILIGLGTGGAIGNGGPNSTHVVLDVSKSTFDHNQAIGGNDNHGNTPIPFFGPNGAGGGAIQIVQGSGNMISKSTFDHNQAIGGQGAPGSDGGIGVGGGIFVFALNPPSPVDVTVTDCAVDHNDAIGGPGGSGGNGGGGAGGGIASLGFSTSLAATLTVTDTTVDHNMARGGPGRAGGNGGNGLGGGLYNGASSTLTLQGATVEYNLALGGGPGGLGIGGGVYNLGTFDRDDSVITKNHASTSNDNIGP